MHARVGNIDTATGGGGGGEGGCKHIYLAHHIGKKTVCSTKIQLSLNVHTVYVHCYDRSNQCVARFDCFHQL